MNSKLVMVKIIKLLRSGKKQPVKNSVLTINAVICVIWWSVQGSNL